MDVQVIQVIQVIKAEIARLLGVSHQTLYDLISERQPVTSAMALRLGKLCGNGAMLWLNLQRRHDLWEAERALGEEVCKVPTLDAV